MGPSTSWSTRPGSSTPAARFGTGATPSTSCASSAGTPTGGQREGRDRRRRGHAHGARGRDRPSGGERRTNPEVADELFLSVKTIETHMRNIFRKLEVSSRLDVAPAIERAEQLENASARRGG